MTTRAASATHSLRAKQDLVRVLFGRGADRSGPQQALPLLLDHAQYSYANLRSAYLERIHKLHPDKQKSQRQPPSFDSTQRDGSTDIPKMIGTSDFVELREAWNRYEALAKLSKRVDKGDCVNMIDANFTMFGVGCSFSDTDEQREKRAKIMDQASRGWFSAGELGDAGENVAASEVKVPLLVCEDLIDHHQRDDGAIHKMEGRVRGGKAMEVLSIRGAERNLVSHLIPPHRR